MRLRPRRPTSAPLLFLTLATALSVWRPPAALALDEEGWQLALGAGYAYLHADERGGGGFSVDLEARRGIAELWALRAALGASWHGFGAAGPRPAAGARSLYAVGGVSWSYDVLRVVPSADLGVVLADVRGDAIRDGHGAVGFEAGAGADYLVDRRWAIGLVARGRFLPVVFGAPDADVGQVWSFAAGLRVARTFD